MPATLPCSNARPASHPGQYRRRPQLLMILVTTYGYRAPLSLVLGAGLGNHPRRGTSQWETEVSHTPDLDQAALLGLDKRANPHHEGHIYLVADYRSVFRTSQAVGYNPMTLADINATFVFLFRIQALPLVIS